MAAALSKADARAVKVNHAKKFIFQQTMRHTKMRMSVSGMGKGNNQQVFDATKSILED
jgi:Holliday junction resolvasome RuvABC endonuclease subunit